MDLPYDYRNCQSLFGYAQYVHERSGGRCQLCDYGSTMLDFDQWRQLTVEHLIGQKQGGSLSAIRQAVGIRFPSLSAAERKQLASILTRPTPSAHATSAIAPRVRRLRRCR